MRAQLDRATAHATLLLECARVAPELSAKALSLWDDASTPFALLDTRTLAPTRVNAAWRSLFEARFVPALLSTTASAARDSGAITHLPEVELDPGPAYCAVTVAPRPLGVVVVCAPTTEEVVARQLGVGESTLIWSVTCTGGTTWTSSSWARYTGGCADWRLALHADDRERCLAVFEDAQRRGPTFDVEVRLRRWDGGYRWHRVEFVVDASRRWFGIATENRDQYTSEDERAALVEQAHAVRANAEHATRLRDRFLAAVSHELRAPLNTLLLWEKVLRDETADSAVRSQALNAIHASAISQSRIVGDLLDVSRAISGKLFVDLRTMDLSRVCREAVRATEPSAQNRGIMLTLSATDDTEVLGDSARLRQVIDNLLSNALQFSARGDSVALALRRDGVFVVLEVTDTGRGIDPDFLPYVFDVFRQADDMLTRPSGGLGLGLAIVRELVALHEGSVAATSQGLGCGTTVTVSLPAAR